MTWIPAFKPGLWNAWMLMSGFLLLLFVPYLAAAFGRTDLLKKMGDVPTDKGGQRNNTLSMGILLLLVVYSIFLPLKLGTAWLVAGLAFWLAGMAILLTALINVARTPPGHIFSTGIYRFSRHPLYLSMSMVFFGVSLASASWLFFVILVGYILLQRSQAQAEERACLEHFGAEYTQYMQKTPRWLGVPHSK